MVLSPLSILVGAALALGVFVVLEILLARWRVQQQALQLQALGDRLLPPPAAAPPLPKLELPPIELPKIELPKIELPPIHVPKVEIPPFPPFPKVEIPPFPPFPKVELPKIEIPPFPEFPKIEIPPFPDPTPALHELGERMLAVLAAQQGGVEAASAGLTNAGKSIEGTATQLRELFFGTKAAVDELKRVRGALDGALARLEAYERQNRETATQIATMTRLMEAMNEALAEQIRSVGRSVGLSRVDQNNLVASIDRLNKAVDRLGGGSSGRSK